MTITLLKAKPYLLINQIQHYAWGTRDAEAFIPRLLGREAEAGRPYAELWMGMHPKAPSALVVEGTEVPLPALVQEHAGILLGARVTAQFGPTLPFLFKVLSIGAALSIQAHPTQAQAQALHARDPEHYPDANHKPEVAIALGPVEALVGLKPYPDMAQTLARYPDIARFLEAGDSPSHPVPASQHAEGARVLYAILMRRAHDEGALADTLERLERALRQPPALDDHEKLFLASRKLYPGADIGLLALFFLNFVYLERGQGVFLEPGVPHAYLHGNLVECMANSDNVVRAGLTPKFKDVETLLDILSDDLSPAPILGGKGEGREIVYRVPVAEFQVCRWRLAAGEVRQERPAGGPAILLITEGALTLRWPEAGDVQSLAMRRGQSCFIPAGLPAFELVAEEPSEVFKAEVPG